MSSDGVVLTCMTFIDDSSPSACARFSRPSLGAIAAVRGGVLLTADARAHGWDKAALHRLLARDGWQCIHRGAWAEHGREIDPSLRLRATVLAHPCLTVSHRRLPGCTTSNSPQRPTTSPPRDTSSRRCAVGG